MGGLQAGGLGEARASSRRPAALLACTALAAGALWSGRAQASEGGVSFYVLGSGGPDAAILPPLKGVYYNNEFFYTDANASANKDFEIGGNVVAGLHAEVPVNFAIFSWVPTTNLFGSGATVAVGAVPVVGEPQIEVDALLTGPFGRQFPISRSDSALILGDPIGTSAIGWKWGDSHLTLSELINVPVGQYRESRLANLSFHRWIGDTSLAYTWHDDKVGWDVSAKAGITFNGTNTYTDYATGTESHYEAAVEKIFTPQFSVAAQAYYFYQVTGDGGSGNRIGPFEGRVTGVGGSAAYKFTVGQTPMTLRLRGFSEYGAVNRPQTTNFALDLIFPLHMEMPPGAAAH